MNQEQKQNEDIEEVIKEAPVNLHQLSKPTVGNTHEWKQQGAYLNCFSCESPHGFHIGINKRYKGRDNQGNLIFENVCTV